MCNGFMLFCALNVVKGMVINMNYIVNLTWDNDANVWIAESDDIPGLVLESGSYDALIERVRFAIPELINLNNPTNISPTLTFLSERQERIVF